MTSLMLLFAVLFLFPGTSQAELFGLSPETLTAGTDGLHLTVYEEGRVLVRDVRFLTVPVKGGTMAVPGVPTGLEAGSLHVRSLTSPDGFKILEAGVRSGLGSGRDLLDRMVGRTLRVRLPGDGEAEPSPWREATLLVVGDPPVLRMAEGVYIGSVEAWLLPEAPDTGACPQLFLTVENSGPAEQKLEIAYLVHGLSWRSDYRLDLNPGGGRGLLSAWATLKNDLDTGFTDARLTLVSGQVNRNERYESALAPASKEVFASADASGGMTPTSVFAYHVYEPGRSLDMGPGETRLLPLLEAADVRVKRELVSTFDGFYMNSTSAPVSQAVAVRLTVANDSGNNLGLPLPAGAVKVFQKRKQGDFILVGEDRLEHTPRGKDLVLAPGNAFDVSVERMLKDFQRQGENGALQTWQITCLNGGDEAVDLFLEDVLPGEWKIVSADAEHSRQGSLLRIPLRLGAGGSEGNKTVVTYTVSIIY